ncbi:MAG: hypothetical protein V4513_08960 [Pseudomonadota bacterium]
MIPWTFLSLLPVLFGLTAFQAGPLQQGVSRLVVQDEVILRVPVFPRQQRPQVVWLERNKGPNCIPVAAIRRALLLGPERVDFILANRTRFRAELEENCQGLDFYGNLYLKLPDQRLCAGRDEVHSRMGGSCRISRFKQLVPRVLAQ